LRDLGTLLNKTEEYVKNPYIWGKYTILVLPPSFPVGGMENPLLTFASPTIMIPDGSQIYVATHEIAHSWTGNLVTCRDWSNVWLNEGFTTFIERRVSAEVDGEDFFNRNIGIFVGNSAINDEKLKQFRQLAYNASQNGQFDIAADAIELESSTEIHRLIKDVVAKREKLAAQQQEQQKFSWGSPSCFP
jgi:hypothetical protein